MLAVNNKLEILTGAIQQIQVGKENMAKEMLEVLVNNRLELDSSSDDLQYFIFASALSKRLGTNLAYPSNIYLRNYDTPQIDFFNLLANQLPLVSMSGLIANELLCKFISGREEVVLVDIGIGTGRQIVNLLKLLAERRVIPKKLIIVGIEPLASSLQKVEENLLNIADQLEINLEFYPFGKLVENFDEEDWNTLKKLPGDLIINESFAVHHILKNGKEPDIRDEVFYRLKQLNPVVFVLSEPNSDHCTEDLWSRFNNCWKHFGLTFNIIDQLDIPDKNKDTIKVHFFGREIEDILGNSEEQRCEKHETAQMWSERLKKAGFKINHDFDSLFDLSTDIITVSFKGDYIGLDYKGETIVSILCGV